MDLEHKAIERLKEAAKLSEFYYQKPLLLTYSGGKDSDVCLELCRRAGVPFEVIHSLTTADAPETVYHVRKVFHKLEMEGVKCEILHPRYEGQPTSMWALIPQKRLPPTRTKRWCCQILKEGSSPHRCVVLGVRKHESIGRADAEVAETQGKSKKDRLTFDFDNGDERIIAVCQTKAEIKIHPIDDIIKALREAEEVDAISVVHCKDCRWYETSRTTHPECLLHCEIGEPDYFCASGESRTELERRINNETTNN